MSTAPRVEILLARYRESVDWARGLPNVTVYNKGEALDNGMREVMLANVGREGHTYYRFICDRYDDLPDYLICLQANPFDHSPDVMHILGVLLTAARSDRVQLPDFKQISQSILPCNLAGCRFAPNVPLIGPYERVFGERRIFMPFVFGAGAQFIVSKRRILQRPRAFYQNIVDMLSYSVDPIEGHAIERFHGLIFCESAREGPAASAARMV